MSQSTNAQLEGGLGVDFSQGLKQQDQGYQGDQEHGNEKGTIENDERWSLIWAALIIYWAMDALAVFFLALFSLVASIVFKAASSSDNGSQCEVATIMFYLSLVIFLTRLIDMTLGCCTIGSWFCRKNTGNDDRQLIPHIRNCIIICTTQGVLSLVSIVYGIIGLTTEGSACAGSAISIVFSVLLILDAGWEMFIWIGAYFLRINQHNAPIPPIVDKMIPGFLASWARRTRL
mmetsp:Transcript_24714/g.25138  ORF Transcript_24714/g.25138 Transcript_24714/m.25138 type:complete len:232 (-) Transcript_24714:263-958(-)